MEQNIVWHRQKILRADREQHKKQKSCVLWFTGLSGSGKSTIANAVEEVLFGLGCHTYLLDGDNVRHSLSSDLGFSDQDRIENIRRISEVSKLFVDAGIIVCTAFISPFNRDRIQARRIVGEDRFIEIFIDTPLDICESRDPKGLYKKARDGEIKNFTGLDSAYEVPENPALIIKTDQLSVDMAVRHVIKYLHHNQFISEFLFEECTVC